MKLKLLRRRLSISAPRMTVRTHVPWPVRIIAYAAMATVALGVGVWIYHAGAHITGFDSDLRAQVRTLRDQVETLTAERDRLATAASSAERLFSIDRAAQLQMATQIKSLEVENAKLKDDIAFFENLSATGPISGLAIKRFQVERDALPRQMHYRILVTQGGKSERNFTGELQLILTLQQGGKAVIITLPDNAAGSDPKAFLVSFRFYKRLDGVFQIPEGAVLKQVEARILEHGTIRAQQTAMVG